jgi:hypothetical protein
VRNKFEAFTEEEEKAATLLDLSVEGGDWGDLLVEEEGIERAKHVPAPIYYAAKAITEAITEVATEATTEYPSWEPMEEKLWSQTFAHKLEELTSDVFGTASLSDAEYDAFMSFLYAEGWSVTLEDRAFVRAYTDDLPSRVWIPPAVNQQPKKKSSTTVVPRFCVKCNPSSPAESCRYVHGDTIQRVDKPCSFGEACSKKAGCLYIHPGETWSADLVIHRPVAA